MRRSAVVSLFLFLGPALCAALPEGKPALRLAVSLAPASLAPGDTVRVTTTVFNDGSAEARLTPIFGQESRWLKWSDAAGVRVPAFCREEEPPPSLVKPGDYPVIGAGKSRDFTFEGVIREGRPPLPAGSSERQLYLDFPSCVFPLGRGGGFTVEAAYDTDPRWFRKALEQLHFPNLLRIQDLRSEKASFQASGSPSRS